VHTDKTPKPKVELEYVADGGRSDGSVRCLDLFSGIGGISYALSDIFTTALYCEIDALCRQILRARMSDGRLHTAPIHDDIQTLKIKAGHIPEMLCGGFPCQDISKIGLGKGIEVGGRSGMFYEIMRLVDECPGIHVLFLENVANILRCGLKTVIEELAVRGFSAYWLMKSAAEMGALHERKRWFSLAVRGGFDVKRLQRQSSVVERQGQVPARVSLKPEFAIDSSWCEDWAARSATLGNSVVPCVVRAAFDELVEKALRWDKIAVGLKPFKTPLSKMGYPFTNEGLLYGGALYPMPIVTGRTRLRGDSGGKAAYSIRLPDGSMRLSTSYPTPRHGNVRPSRLTERTSKDLATILVHCQETSAYVDSILPGAEPIKVCVPNVAFLEYMMGYPQGWTQI